MADGSITGEEFRNSTFYILNFQFRSSECPRGGGDRRAEERKVCEDVDHEPMRELYQNLLVMSQSWGQRTAIVRSDGALAVG